MLSNLQAIVFKYKHITLYCFITMKQMFLPNETSVPLGRNRFYLVCIFQRSLHPSDTNSLIILGQ